jgi:HPt (histidine-containing phosphotransfer) domain-containing protein
LQNGFDDYVSKPIGREELYAAISKHLVNGRRDISTHSLGCSSVDWLDVTTSTVIDDDEKAEMLAEFIDRLADQVTELDVALQAGDTVTVSRQAHSLKGSAALYGLNEISAKARQVEEAATDECDKQGLQMNVGELLELCRTVIAKQQSTTTQQPPNDSR